MTSEEQQRAIALYEQIHAILKEAGRTQDVDQLLRLSIRYNAVRVQLDPLMRKYKEVA
jgi:hypothetical protein